MQPGKQFQLFDPGPPSALSQGGPSRPRSEAVDKLTVAAIERFPHEPPVGLRGSVPERVALGDRFQRRDQNRQVWQSYRNRDEDSNIADVDEDERPSIEAHPRTGLPDKGEVSLHKDIGFGVNASVPDIVKYGAPGSRAIWRAHARDAFVPTPALHTEQPAISAQRLHAVIEHPETTKSPRFPGMAEERPRVFHDRMHDTYSTVDGNHRLSGDLLQGKLFSEVRLMDNRDLPAARKTASRMRNTIDRAGMRPDVDQDAVYQRQMHNIYGTDNW